MSEIVEFHAALRLIPVVVIDDVGDAEPLATALCAGGLPSAEVTLRTPVALEALQVMAAQPGFVVGAGTVIHPRQVAPALDAGAQYVVTPGFSESVARECDALGVLMIPGVATSTEVLTALDAGCEVLKLFPADVAGGVPLLRALSAPYASVRFVPTGGIDSGSLEAYLRLRSVVAVGGSWMAPRSLVKAREFDRVTELTAAAVAVAADNP